MHIQPSTRIKSYIWNTETWTISFTISE